MREYFARRPPPPPPAGVGDFGTALENFLRVREIFYAICARTPEASDRKPGGALLLCPGDWRGSLLLLHGLLNLPVYFCIRDIKIDTSFVSLPVKF